MKIYYGGHSSFLLESNNNRILVDPMMISPKMAEKKPTLIAVSHGHGDHIGDSEKIAKKNDIPIMAVFELANYFAKRGCKTVDGHIGGKIKFDFGFIKYVTAFHGNSTPDGTATGNPCGFVFNIDGITVYHTGDTGLFGDMELIAKQTPVDVLLCPIGDKYTMGPEDAIVATKLVNPKIVIPMHYNTFPLIAQDPEDFKKKVEKDSKTKVVIMKANDVFEYNK